jgi:hypothetical protein
MKASGLVFVPGVFRILKYSLPVLLEVAVRLDRFVH